MKHVADVEVDKDKGLRNMILFTRLGGSIAVALDFFGFPGGLHQCVGCFAAAAAADAGCGFSFCV